MSELISIVIPIYNAETTLKRCLDAVRNQTYTNIQAVLIDDGAKDGSGKICDEYVELDSRFVVVHKENGGLSSARNAGIERADGEFIGFLDSDDWPETDMFENLYNAYKKFPDANIAQMMSRDFMPDGTLVKGPYKDSGETVWLDKKDYFSGLMCHTGDSSFCTKLFRAEWIKKYRFKEKTLNEDLELLLRMLPEIKGIATVEKVGYNIELSPVSIQRGRFNGPLYEAMMVNAEKAMEVAEKYFPECITEAKRFVLAQSLIYLLHVPVKDMTSDNMLYQQEKRRIKSSKREIKENPFLDEKQRKNLLILAYLPMRTVRWAHGIVMKIRKK